MQIVLPDRMKQFVVKQAFNRGQSASEYMRSLIREKMQENG